MCKKHLNNIKPYKQGKPIEEVKRELGLKKVIKLASNESPRPPSKKTIEAIKKQAASVNRYPDGGCFYLREALSKKLSIPGDNIVFGNGSDEIIILALQAFVKPGDEVITANPTFLVYGIASMVKGARVREVPLKNYKYDLEAMLKAVTRRTRVVFIANPDNPTGTYVTKKELDLFLKNVPRDILVFIDEAYYEFARGGDYPETLSLIKTGNRNIIIARTFSKAYGLAGLRIGYGLAGKDIADILNKVREPFNVNSLAQTAAIAALSDDSYMEETIKFIKEEKEKYCGVFKSLNVGYLPSKANFILINTKRDSKEIFNRLLAKGIIVREMSEWGLDGFIRVTIGLPDENKAFFKAFREIVAKV
ncbi:MAG: histidinol-phosphate transaminase [Candidatus Omnitrophota bacterium]